MKELKALPEPSEYNSMGEFAKALDTHNTYLADIAENHKDEYPLEEVLQQAIKVKLAMHLLEMIAENGVNTCVVTKENNTDKQEALTRPDDAVLH